MCADDAQMNLRWTVQYSMQIACLAVISYYSWLSKDYMGYPACK